MNETHYNNLVEFLQTQQLPTNLSQQQQQQLQNQSKIYQVHNKLLYKIARNKTKLRVVRHFEMEPVLFMFHYDPTAAHSSKEKMMEKMRTRYYWPQMFEDIRAYVESCDPCQRRGKSKRNEQLHPIPVGAPFYQIGIDYVGPLNRTINGNRYIIVAMDYLTKWPEAKPVPEATAAETVKFVYEDIICRHGCPGRILTDRGTHFNNQLLNGILKKFQVEHLLSTPYHPQTNGLVERFNRTLIEALSKVATENLSEWDKYIAPVLFAYRTNRHSTTRITPFYLVYGREAKLPTDNTTIEEERHVINHIETQVDQLPLIRNQAQRKIHEEQQKQKDRHDHKIKQKLFQVDDQVLYYRAMLDKQWSKKLEPKWKGPYAIHKIIGNGAYQLREHNGQIINTPVNGCYLKLYKDRAVWRSTSQQ